MAHAHGHAAGLAPLTLMWFGMMAAMMAPTVWPWIRAFGRLDAGRSGLAAAAATGTFAGGYLAAWLGYSVGAAGLQQALHAAFWKQRVLNRVIGTQPFPRKGQNWPELPRPRTASAWKADQALLRAIHQRLMQAVRELDQARYSPRLRKMLYGISAHDVYHAGQIKLLRKMLEPAE